MPLKSTDKYSACKPPLPWYEIPIAYSFNLHGSSDCVPLRGFPDDEDNVPKVYAVSTKNHNNCRPYIICVCVITTATVTAPWRQPSWSIDMVVSISFISILQIDAISAPVKFIFLFISMVVHTHTHTHAVTIPRCLPVKIPGSKSTKSSNLCSVSRTNF